MSNQSIVEAVVYAGQNGDIVAQTIIGAFGVGLAIGVGMILTGLVMIAFGR